MTSSSDAIVEMIRLARGERPFSFTCQEAETVLNMTLSLAVELSVANDKIARLESSVAALSGKSVADWQAQALAGEDAAERAQASEAMLLRVLRIVLDPRRPVDGRNGA